MKIEAIMSALAEREEAAKSSAPEPCLGCPNLRLTRDAEGRPVPTCDLAGATTDLPEGQVDGKANATAGWLERVLQHADNGPDEILHFRGYLESANDNCPIIAQIVDQVPGAGLTATIDLTPTTPLIPS